MFACRTIYHGKYNNGGYMLYKLDIEQGGRSGSWYTSADSITQAILLFMAMMPMASVNGWEVV